MAYEQDLQYPFKTTQSSEEKIKAGVCAAQWLVINASIPLEEALKKLNLTYEQFEKYKDMPES